MAKDGEHFFHIFTGYWQFVLLLKKMSVWFIGSFIDWIICAFGV
jgi:hypothetical protein